MHARLWCPPGSGYVNFKRLSKQLKRELTANPKKAGLLGLVTLVAVYFWLPLVWGWVGGGKSQTVAAIDPPQDAINMAQPTASTAGQPIPPDGEPQHQADIEWKPTHDWPQLVKLIDNDPRTLPASVLPRERDPFGTPTLKIVQTADKEDEEETEIADDSFTPQSLGMVLSTTIVGDKWQVARINGKTYKQGQDIKVAKDGKELNFEVVEILPQSVILKRKERQFELKISPDIKSGTIEMYSDNN